VLRVPLGLVQVAPQVPLALQVLVPPEQLAWLGMTEPQEPPVLRAQTEQPEPQA
jgi:hypothetical protein